MINRIKGIYLDDEEYKAFVKLCELEVRGIDFQIMYLIRQELIRRGLLKLINEKGFVYQEAPGRTETGEGV
ncbi:MAG TPA: hypothetical protein PKX41_11965 [Anaerolineaceae bacterium]|nr:hypothetical protein [Anaerolineaceae bacterium]